eukprot:m.287001 g.287001  ORF g.287001 m.287001 type:complete len:689 (-) comp19942_c0_seq1:328-2394(-)
MWDALPQFWTKHFNRCCLRVRASHRDLLHAPICKPVLNLSALDHKIVYTSAVLNRTYMSQQQIALRPYQIDCIEYSLELMRNGITRQAVSLPVGSGKTVIFSHLIPRIPKPREGAHQTLVLAHRTELLHQAAQKISSANPDLHVSIEQGKDFATEDADVIVASVPTLGRKGSQRLLRFNPAKFKCIIVDEAHHITASTYLRILDYFGVRSHQQDQSGIFLWGCTATLRRHDGISLGAVFDTIGYKRTLLEMWEEGWLCQATPNKIDTNVSLSNVKTSSSTRDFSSVGLSAAVNTAARNQIIVESWRTYAQTSNRSSTLVFCVDVAHVKAVQAAFVASGVQAFFVDGETPAEERAQILDSFRAGKIPVLINCGVFTEGTDIPCVDCIIMARPTKSSVLFQQMLGRGLRMFPGKRDCLVLDLTDNFGRNTVITLPSLLGLIPDFDTMGADIYSVYSKLKKLTAQCPEVVLARTLDDATLRVKRHQAALLEAGDDALAVVATPTQSQLSQDKKNYSALSPLAFVQLHGDYFLEVPMVGTIRVWEDVLGHFKGELLISDEMTMTSDCSTNTTTRAPVTNEDVLELPFTADTLESAFNAIKTYLQREYPRQTRKLLNKGVQFSTDPATDKQMALLSRLTGGRMRAENMTKGHATQLIDKIISKRSGRGVRRNATLRKHVDQVQRIKHGLKPQL